ncbi:hypothetical protein L218DRAFT_990291 [Marasmius fiardii PR-910]|nr:hypothetical protein L218DRAFT_990291 [Marasmius fiardii PR-910]
MGKREGELAASSGLHKMITSPSPKKTSVKDGIERGTGTRRRRRRKKQLISAPKIRYDDGLAILSTGLVLDVRKLPKPRSFICALNHAPLSNANSQRKREKSTTVYPQKSLKEEKERNEKERKEREHDLTVVRADDIAALRALAKQVIAERDTALGHAGTPILGFGSSLPVAEGSIPRSIFEGICGSSSFVFILDFRGPNIGLSGKKKTRAVINKALDSLDLSIDWSNQPYSKLAEVYGTIEEAVPHFRIFEKSWATEFLARRYYSDKQYMNRKKSR